MRYVLPVMATMLIGSAYGSIDGLFVSNMVGKTALASIAIVTPFVMVLSTLGVMMGAGGGAIVGQLLGSGRIKDANKVFSLVAAATLTAGMLCSIVGIIAMEQVVLLLCASPDIFSLAVFYGRIVFLSMPMFMLTYVFELFAGTEGRPGLGLASATVAGVVNIGLDVLFMGLYGENGVAAYAVIEYAAMLVGAILGGLSDGIAPLMSFQQGAGNASEKRSLFRQGFFLTAAASAAAILCFVITIKLGKRYGWIMRKF